MTQDDEKRLVGEAAARHVEDGMTIGLGTGSTVAFFAAALETRIAGGLRVRAVPTSAQSLALAEAHDIPVTDLDTVEELDLTVDGADEVAADLSMIKGGGSALLHEKIVAVASKRRIFIADSKKLVRRLGAFPLPVEVSPFGHGGTAKKIAQSGAEVTLRMSGDAPLRSSDNNLIYDCAYGEIVDPPGLERDLGVIPGVVESGLFIGLIDRLIAVRDERTVELLPGDPVWWA